MLTYELKNDARGQNTNDKGILKYFLLNNVSYHIDIPFK